MRLLSLTLVLSLLVGGCIRTNTEVVADGRVDDALQTDALQSDGPLPDGPLPDGPLPDLTSTDAPLPDQFVPDAGPPCVSKADPDTLLLYTFSGSGTTVTDVTGKHPGKLVGSSVARVPGSPGCGAAVAFPNSAAHYIEIADAPAWDLAQGSVDLWVRVDTPSSLAVRGIVSRDADNSVKPGHFSLLQLPDNGIAVRLQHTTNQGAVRCSPPVSFGVWHHVGVNFGTGGLQLFVDGVVAKRTDQVIAKSLTLTCGTSSNLGIAGNDNPWVLGASTHQSVEGTATPTSYPFDGAIDSFRISKARRAFGATP